MRLYLKMPHSESDCVRMRRTPEFVYALHLHGELLLTEFQVKLYSTLLNIDILFRVNSLVKVYEQLDLC